MPLTEEQRAWIGKHTTIRRSGVKQKSGFGRFEKLEKFAKDADANLKAVEDLERRLEKTERLLVKLKALLQTNEVPSDLALELASVNESANAGEFIIALEKITELKTKVHTRIDVQAKIVSKQEDKAKALVSAVAAARKALAEVESLRGVGDESKHAEAKALVDKATQVLNRVRREDDVTKEEQAEQVKSLKNVPILCGELRVLSVRARDLAHEEVKAAKAWGAFLRRFEPALLDLYQLPKVDEDPLLKSAVQAVANLRTAAQTHIDNGKGAGGYVAALREVALWEIMVDDVRQQCLQASTEGVKEELKSSILEVQTSIQHLRPNAPALVAASFAEALQVISEDKKRSDPLMRLRLLKGEVDEEANRLLGERKVAEEVSSQWAELLNTAVLPPKAALRIRAIWNEAQDLYDERYWEDAASLWTRGIEETQRFILTEETHRERWTQAEKVLEQAVALSLEMKMWQPVNSAAQALLDQARQVQALYQRDEQMETALSEFDTLKIAESYQELLNRVTSESMPRGAQVRQFTLVYTAGFNKLDEQRTKIRRAMEPLKSLLAQRGQVLGPSWDQKLNGPVNEWINFYKHPPTNALKALPETLGRLEEELSLLETEVQNALVSNEEEPYSSTFAPAKNEEQIERAQQLIQTLEKAKHPSAGKLRDALRLAVEGAQSEDGPKKLTRVILAAERFHQLEQAKVSQRLEAIRQDETQIRKGIQGREVPNDFRPYLDLLAEEADDISLLAQSDDPDLLAAAEQRMIALRAKVEKVEDHSAVEKKYSELSALLGDEALREGLPDTHGRLHKALQEAIHKANRCDAVAGLALVNDLDADVTEAHKLAKARVAEVKDLKAALERALSLFGEIKRAQLVGTGSLEHFSKVIEAEVEEINELLKSEGTFSKASEAVSALHKRLNTFPTDPLEVQTHEREAAEVSRTNKDRARLLRAEANELRDAVLIPLEAAAKKDPSIDKRLLRGIRKQLHNAKVMADTLSPLQEKSAQQFEEAQSIVRTSREALARLSQQEGGTKLKITGDLHAVLTFWTKQAIDFGKVLRQVAQGVAQEAATDTVESVQQHGEEAKARILAVARLFPSSAFDKPLRLLLVPPTSDKPDRKRLDARETALRTMRRLRGVLLRHPVLKKLAHKNNPFEGPRVLAATAMVRTALKRVEREVLISQ